MYEHSKDRSLYKIKSIVSLYPVEIKNLFNDTGYRVYTVVGEKYSDLKRRCKKIELEIRIHGR